MVSEFEAAIEKYQFAVAPWAAVDEIRRLITQLGGDVDGDPTEEMDRELPADEELLYRSALEGMTNALTGASEVAGRWGEGAEYRERLESKLQAGGAFLAILEQLDSEGGR